CAVVAGWFALNGRRRGLQIGALLLAGLSFTLWGAIPALWQDILSFRFFLVPVMAPFVALAALDALRPGERAWAERRALVRVVGGIFALTLVLQSFAWGHMMTALRDVTTASAAACLPTPRTAEALPPEAGPRLDWLWSSRASQTGALDWVYFTPINHWSITSLAFLVQGNAPRTLVLPGDGCATADFGAGLPLAPWEVRSWNARHFDFEPLRARLAR
ncbi:MAG: hypothetical protein IT323_07430, partial [Anaerolineae bacterium]|nr:hypothetical protein [Anaerolineae bacterium]